jgi:hypothetical protein
MESPDGLTAARVLPAINWTFHDGGPKDASIAQCRMFPNAIPASDVLKFAIKLLNVEYVSEAPTDIDEVRKKFAAGNRERMQWSADKARAKVKFKVNSIEMDGRVTALVACQHNELAKLTLCSATISRSWAPAGQYDDAAFEATQKTLSLNQEWLARREAVRMKETTDAQEQKVITDPVQRRHDPVRTARLESIQIFERQRDDLFPNAAPEHDAGDIGTHPRSMIRKPPVPDRVVDDWADYVIQISPALWRANDETAGMAAKAREYVWENAAGETLSTASINDNPNGKDTGSWALQPDTTEPKP